MKRAFVVGQAVPDPLDEGIVEVVGFVAHEDAAGADFADEGGQASVPQSGSFPVVGGEQAGERDGLGVETGGEGEFVGDGFAGGWARAVRRRTMASSGPNS